VTRPVVTSSSSPHPICSGTAIDVLARDHLADHPDNLLVAWIASATRTAKEPR
jgi:hypothetical protein